MGFEKHSSHGGNTKKESNFLCYFDCQYTCFCSLIVHSLCWSPTRCIKGLMWDKDFTCENSLFEKGFFSEEMKNQENDINDSYSSLTANKLN